MNILLIIILSLFWLVVSYYFYLKNNEEGLGKAFIILYSYRILFFTIQSVVFYFIYHNQVDSLAYYEDLKVLFSDFIDQPMESVHFFSGHYENLHIEKDRIIYFQEHPRVAFFLKVLFPFYLISGGNYILVGLWISLFGTYCFVKFLSVYKERSVFFIWYLVLLVPSISFWTVGILKEAFVIPVLFLLYFFYKKAESNILKNYFYVVLFSFFLFLAWNIKYYYVAVFLLVGIGNILFTKVRLSFYYILLVSAIGFAFIVLLGQLHPNLSFSEMPEAIYQSYLSTRNLFSSVACVEFSLDGSWLSIIKNLPKAFIEIFYSPGFLQIYNISSFLAGIESHILLLLTLFMLYKWILKGMKISRKDLILLFCIMITGSLLIMASPNIGSFSRYRTIYMPVYCYILFKNTEVYKWVDFVLKKPLKTE